MGAMMSQALLLTLHKCCNDPGLPVGAHSEAEIGVNALMFVKVCRAGIDATAITAHLMRYTERKMIACSMQLGT